jgi:hypothetical protein
MDDVVLKVGIVGARKRNTPEDKEIIRKILEDRIKKGNNLILISGGCPRGADRFAEELAVEFNLEIIIHPPNVSANTQKWEYAQACFDRNTLIAQECDILLALPGETGGTWDTIKKARSLNKPVVIL